VGAAIAGGNSATSTPVSRAGKMGGPTHSKILTRFKNISSVSIKQYCFQIF